MPINLSGDADTASKDVNALVIIVADGMSAQCEQRLSQTVT